MTQRLGNARSQHLLWGWGTKGGDEGERKGLQPQELGDGERAAAGAACLSDPTGRVRKRVREPRRTKASPTSPVFGPPAGRAHQEAPGRGSLGSSVCGFAAPETLTDGRVRLRDSK